MSDDLEGIRDSIRSLRDSVDELTGVARDFVSNGRTDRPCLLPPGQDVAIADFDDYIADQHHTAMLGDLARAYALAVAAHDGACLGSHFRSLDPDVQPDVDAVLALQDRLSDYAHALTATQRRLLHIARLTRCP